MAERLKDIYFTKDSMGAFADIIGKVYPNFNKRKFLDLIYDGTFKTMKFMDKSRHTTHCLHETLPKSFKKTLDILKTAAPIVKGVEALSLPDYVATYGLDDCELSVLTLGQITKYVTAELAIRPFFMSKPTASCQRKSLKSQKATISPEHILFRKNSFLGICLHENTMKVHMKSPSS